MARLKTLRRCGLCRSMTWRELGVMAPFFREEKAGEGQWIAEEGKPTSGLIILKGGRVRLGLEKTREAHLDLGPGDFFGELSLVNGDQTRAVGAKALENCEFLRLHPTDYHQLAAKYPEVGSKLAQGVLESMTEKMELTKQLLKELALEKAPN